jgi:glucokinase
VIAAPTLWPGEAFAAFPLASHLHERWGCPVHVLNDVSAAGYAYREPERTDFCVVTVSSGIGHKVFVDGRPVVGPSGLGGEIGHVTAPGGHYDVTCDCGGSGHLGAIASGRGMTASARRAARDDPEGFAGSTLAERCGSIDRITAEVLAAAFRANDGWATRVVRACSEPLGWMLAMLHAAVGVEDFIIIGGFADALGSGFCAELAACAEHECWRPARPWREMISLGDLGGVAGLIGAGRFAVRSGAAA